MKPERGDDSSDRFDHALNETGKWTVQPGEDVEHWVKQAANDTGEWITNAWGSIKN